MEKFIFITDLHYGYERDVYRHKKPIHDLKAMNVALQFMDDFKPAEIILGGDMLDCGCIGPHKKKDGERLREGLRLRDDAKEMRSRFINRIEVHKKAKKRYLEGNHEAWLNQLIDHEPGLEGIVDLKTILSLGDEWDIIAQGKYFKLGKYLIFIHGDQYKGGGEYVAKKAVIDYEASVRMGHFHSLSIYTKSAALDIRDNKTGMVVPCLSAKGPQWVRGSCE